MHDYTYTFQGHKISLLKQLEGDFRVFMVGHGPGVQRGDVVVVCAKSSPPTNIKYRVESISYVGDESWRAYARMESRVVRRTKAPQDKFSLVPRKTYHPRSLA